MHTLNKTGLVQTPTEHYQKGLTTPNPEKGESNLPNPEKWATNSHPTLRGKEVINP